MTGLLLLSATLAAGQSVIVAPRPACPDPPVVPAQPQYHTRAAFDAALAEYHAAVTLYAGCDDAGHERLLALGIINASVLSTVVNRIPEDVVRGQCLPAIMNWPPALLRAAIAAHTELALTSEFDAAEHLELVRRFAGKLHTLEREDRTAALAYALVLAQLTTDANAVSLAQLMQEVPDPIRQDPLVTLAMASANELLASPMIQPPMRTLAARSDRSLPRGGHAANIGRYRNRAVQGFRATTEADGREAEAYVRLARLLMDDGKAADARALLAAAGDLPQAPRIRYYALLLTGRMEEREGAAQAAERAYREAATLAPTAQTPQLALAHLLASGGRRGEASRLLRQALSAGVAAREQIDDPWWQYPLGQFWRRAELATELRTLARACHKRSEPSH